MGLIQYEKLLHKYNMRIIEIVETIGPHNNKELALMIQGTKPAALVFDTELTKWKPYIDKFKWTVTSFKDFNGGVSYAVSKDPNGAKQIVQLFQTATTSKVGPEFHAQLGRLLGYSEKDIAEFLAQKTSTGILGSTGRILGQLGRSMLSAVKVVGGAAATLATYSPGLNSGEDEELARIRAQGPRITPRQ